MGKNKNKSKMAKPKQVKQMNRVAKKAPKPKLVKTNLKRLNIDNRSRTDTLDEQLVSVRGNLKGMKKKASQAEEAKNKTIKPPVDVNATTSKLAQL